MKLLRLPSFLQSCLSCQSSWDYRRVLLHPSRKMVFVELKLFGASQKWLFGRGEVFLNVLVSCL